MVGREVGEQSAKGRRREKDEGCWEEQEEWEREGKRRRMLGREVEGQEMQTIRWEKNERCHRNRNK